MASGDVEHSELPDNLLHEPKGASTAGAGTVYIADGAGKGSFKKLPISSLAITVKSVANTSATVITNTVNLNGAALTQLPDGSLKDVPSDVNIPQEITNAINKNFSEVNALYINQKKINSQVKEDITEINNKLNELINALKGVGIING